MVLGPSLTYSCAVWADDTATLEDAQANKHELICRKLDLRPGMRLLDIGCGWGGMVLHAAEHHGVRAVGVTLSRPQAELARKRAAERGLGDLVEVRHCDYRDVSDGPYDAISSIGMFEHVGLSELDGYFARCRTLAPSPRPAAQPRHQPPAPRRKDASPPVRPVVARTQLHRALRLPRRGAARDRRRRLRHPARRLRGPPHGEPARALRVDAALLGAQPGSQLGRRGARGRRRTGPGLAPLHGRRGGRLRARRQPGAPRARDAHHRRGRAACPGGPPSPEPRSGAAPGRVTVRCSTWSADSRGVHPP